MVKVVELKHFAKILEIPSEVNSLHMLFLVLKTLCGFKQSAPGSSISSCLRNEIHTEHSEMLTDRKYGKKDRKKW